MTKKEMETYDMMVEIGIATSEEINLVKCLIAGTWMDILNSIIYARTGYRTLNDYFQAEDEEEE